MPCFSPWYNLSVFPNGDVRPCFLHESSPDNIMDKHIKEVWNGEKFSMVREDFTDNKKNEGCRNCNIYNILDNEMLRSKLVDFSNPENLWPILRENQAITESHKEMELELEKLKKEIDNLRNSKGYRYVVKPLERIHASIKGKKKK